MNDPHPPQDRLLPFVCGELDARAAADFQAHLAACPACAREIAAQRQLDGVLRGAFARQQVDASAVRERVMRLVQAEGLPAPRRETAAGKFPAWGRRPWDQLRVWAAVLRRPIPAFALALLAVGLVATAVFVLPARRQPLGGEPRAMASNLVYAAVAADHFEEVVQQTKHRDWVRGNAVQELTRARFQDPTLAATLTPEGEQFTRARLCRLAGGEFAHFVYAGADGRETVSVFVQQRDPSQGGLSGRPAGRTADGRPLYTARRGETRLAGFDAPGMTVFVVGEIREEETLRLARAAAARLGT